MRNRRPPAFGTCGGTGIGDPAQALEPGQEARIVEVELDRENLSADFRRDAEDGEIILGGVNAQCGVEFDPGVIAHIHRRENGNQEEPYP